ncbi:serine protease ami-like [Cimex lectularius]|uniref:Peptidase S1 domain-containing protein n=1 Tax=Cimex lectularius TaxID=79782 RepID=A0A8I6SAZ5_CIMLE|nr:serine protease ami-like [Cimex lectularius]
MLKSKFTIQFPLTIITVTLGTFHMVPAESIKPIPATYNTRFATEAEFPFKGNIITNTISCGSIIMSETFVLSAAHCFIRFDSSGRKKYIDLSDAFMLFGSLLQGEGLMRRIEHYSVSPNYQMSQTSPVLHADIAVAYLNEPLKFSYKIQPATVVSTDPMVFLQAWNNIVDNEKACYVMGWALMKENGMGSYDFYDSDFLRVSAVSALTDEKCKNSIGNEEDNIVRYGGVCAKHMVLNEDVMAGDAGAALYCEGNVFGVLSALKAHKEYTRIAHFFLLKDYLSHIEDEVSEGSIKKGHFFISTILPYVITNTLISK